VLLGLLEVEVSDILAELRLLIDGQVVLSEDQVNVEDIEDVLIGLILELLDETCESCG